MALAWTITFYILLAAATYLLMIQVRRPSRYLGRVFTATMNRSHSLLTDWGLKFVDVQPAFTILDIGCGGGRTIGKLADLAPSGHIYGVDPGNGSVAASRAYNRKLLDTRVTIDHGSVSKLPYDNDRFDLVTAVETQYYWPQPVNDLREVLRVLKPGSRLIVILESYKGGTAEWLQAPGRLILGYKTYTAADHRKMFDEAGFAGVEIHEHKKEGWLAVIGSKPS